MSEAPRTTFNTDLHGYRWSDGVEIRLTRFSEDREGGVKAHVTFAHGPANDLELITNGALNLSAMSTRKTLAKDLADRHPLTVKEWMERLDYVCGRSSKEYEEGASTLLNMADVEIDRSQSMYLLPPLLPENTVTIDYGDSGRGKSTFVLAQLLTVATGHPFLGIRPTFTGPVTYFDWEDHEGPLRARMEALCEGAGVDFPTNVHYRAVDRPLATGEARVKREIEQTKSVLVAVDSMGMAMGGDPSDNNLVIPAANAMRRLRTTVLGIHHLSAAQAESTDLRAKQRPYGSKYAGAAARSTWLLESIFEEGDEESHLYAFHTKVNHGPRSRPLSWAVNIQSDEHGFPSSIVYTPRSAADYFDRIRSQQAEHAPASLTIPNAIERVMERERFTRGFSAKMLAREVTNLRGKEVDEHSIRTVLARDGRFEKSSDGFWGRKSERDDEP